MATALTPAAPVFGIPVADVHIDGARAGSVHEHNAVNCPCAISPRRGFHHVAVCGALDGWRETWATQAAAVRALTIHRKESH